MPRGIITEEATRERARALRAQGLYYREIGAQLGVSLKTVHEWCVDPERAKARARRARYSGVCIDCGGVTVGIDGPGTAPERCIVCSLDAKRVPASTKRAKARVRQRERITPEQRRLYAARQRSKAGAKERERARTVLNEAIARGEVRRPTTCERCGGSADFNARHAYIHAHHDDYSQPLDVRWLCARCHKQHHIQQAKAMIA